MKLENTDVWGFKHALRGMRNPMNSWKLSDSKFDNGVEIGENDMGLSKKLINAGNEHRKFLRQIMVSVDITAPLYWWKEFDTYKIGTVANSCSTMHRIHSKPFELSDFSYEHLFNDMKLQTIIKWLNQYRELYVNWDDSKKYKDTKGRIVNKKDVWWQMIQLLPSSYNQKRTVTMDYENIRSMVHQRSSHKLDEWSKVFIDWAHSLPYADELLFDEK